MAFCHNKHLEGFPNKLAKEEKESAKYTGQTVGTCPAWRAWVGAGPQESTIAEAGGSALSWGGFRRVLTRPGVETRTQQRKRSPGGGGSLLVGQLLT